MVDLIYSAGNPLHALEAARIFYAVTMGSDINIEDFYDDDETAEIIFLDREGLWERLRETHKFRVVK